MTEVGDWRDVFGHDEPYPEQADGINAAVSTAKKGGFSVIEGACGTGKTMLALTAGIHLVRDPDSDFERVLVLTSVKQQLRQFEEDLQSINRTLPDEWSPISAITLVGKADVCPYNLTGTGGIDDGNVYERCEGLRDRTRGLTEETTSGSLVDRARSQQMGLADSGSADHGVEYLEVLGDSTPYPPDTVEYGTGTTATEYCPFYAQFLENLPEDGDPSEAVPFDFTDLGLVKPADLVRYSASQGVCPHSAMGAILPQVEVVIGNYYHAFDPTTVRTFTGTLLDRSTFVVCDEAHMVEPRVRELVSDGVAAATLQDAEKELARVIQPLTLDGGVTGDRPRSHNGPAIDERTAKSEQRTNSMQSNADKDVTVAQTKSSDLIRSELDDADVSLDELQRLRKFLRDLQEELDRRITDHLDAEHHGWRVGRVNLPDEEIPLRDPDEPVTDAITEWSEDAGFSATVWTRAVTLGAVVTRILDEIDEEDRKRAVMSVGRVLEAWYREDHANYFREIELARTWNESAPTESWRRAYNARLALHNCVPGDAIADRLDEFGGGICMSATLAPMGVFERVTGLEHLREEADRPVERRTYGLSFPPENRASFAVSTPKFTLENRGAFSGSVRGDDSENPTRLSYEQALRDVAACPGNVLIGMPSYAEAQWAADVLSDCNKPVLIDESSADDETEHLKEKFFDGDGKVLVTSLRGTLTEGVDYKGDRLAAAAVVGVPLINTASPRTRAVTTAYEREFEAGFETALTIPAVRKARQAIGRVIRGPEEVGVRILLDERYARDSWDSVRSFLGPERDEFRPVSPDMLSIGLEQFWSDQ